MKLNLLLFENLYILDQLRIEEALLRTNQDNWALINMGSKRAIVMGLSSKQEELLHIDRVQREGIPVIQRFSGGGTVIVDEDTIFLSFLFQKEALPIPLFPKPILKWTFDFLNRSLKLPSLTLRESDFALDDRKIGGNAQYIKKDRFLHHTTLLWNYKIANMDLLKLPSKRPLWRNDRDHDQFLGRLKDHLDKSQVKTLLINSLLDEFDVNINPPLPSFDEHRKTTFLIDL